MIGDRWGVTAAETMLPFPCDGFVEGPTLQAWRGVTVAARPEIVWGRVRQLRLAPYSYDLLDNLGHRSPRDRRDLPDPVAGEAFSRAFGRDQGKVVDVDPGRHLTAHIMSSYLSYVIRPRGPQTRLLLKVVADLPRWPAQALCIGDLLMARRQLLRLAALAAQDERET